MRNENTLFYKILSVVFVVFSFLIPQTALAAVEYYPITTPSIEVYDGSWMGANYYARQINNGDDFCGTGFWTLDTDIEIGSLVTDPYGLNPTMYRIDATTLTGGSGTPPPFSMFIDDWGDGNYMITSNNSLSCPGYPSEFADQGSSYMFFGVSGGLLTEYNPIPATGDDGVFPSTPSEASSVTSPVSFTGTYNNGSTFDELVFAVNDLTDMNNQVYTLAIPLINGTSLPYAKSIPLTQNHTYEYRVWLRDSTNGDISEETDWINFQTIEGSTPTPPITPETCDEGGLFPDFPCIIRNAFIWAFVPDASVLNNFAALKQAFASAFPFSFISDILNLFNDGAGAPEYLPTVAINTGFGAPVEIVSQNIVEQSIPEDVASFLKGLITMMLWLGVGFYVYNKAKALAPKN